MCTAGHCFCCSFFVCNRAEMKTNLLLSCIKSNPTTETKLNRIRKKKRMHITKPAAHKKKYGSRLAFHFHTHCRFYVLQFTHKNYEFAKRCFASASKYVCLCVDCCCFTVLAFCRFFEIRS